MTLKERDDRDSDSDLSKKRKQVLKQEAEDKHPKNPRTHLL